MEKEYPHVALIVLNQLASKKGDCSSAILDTASDLGFKTKEHLLSDVGLTCGSENALAQLVDQASFDTIEAEIAKKVNEGSLLPCGISPEQKIQNCFSKCPLVMDLFLQMHQSRSVQIDPIEE